MGTEKWSKWIFTTLLRKVPPLYLNWIKHLTRKLHITGSPIVVYIHGGYWQELTKNQSAYCVSPLIENGYRVIILDYDLCPNVKLEEIVQQIQKAMKFVFDYAGSSDAQSVTIVGHSAGAHLAASVLQEEYTQDIPNLDKLVSVFLISGVYDLTDLRRTTVNRNNMLSLDHTNVINCSPIFHCYKHLKRFNIKFYVYAAENDSPTFIKQSENFHQHLLCNNLHSKLRIVPVCDHFDIVENLAQSDFEITRKIVKQVKSNGVQSL